MEISQTEMQGEEIIIIIIIHKHRKPKDPLYHFKCFIRCIIEIPEIEQSRRNI